MTHPSQFLTKRAPAPSSRCLTASVGDGGGKGRSECFVCQHTCRHAAFQWPANATTESTGGECRLVPF